MTGIIKFLTLLTIFIITVGTGYSVLTTGLNEQLEASYLNDNSVDIVLISPLNISTITSPFQMIGKAKGIWFFEGIFNVRLYDENGKLLGFTNAEAQSEWMTEDYVNFYASLEFETTTSKKGYLIFSKPDPSGLNVNLKEFIIPVSF